MKRLHVLLFLFFGLLLFPVDSNAEQIFVCGGTEVFGEGPVSVLREAYAALGYTLVMKRVPSARSLVESNSGRCDGELGRIADISMRFPNLIQVDVPIFWIDLVAISTRKDRNIRTWKDLSGKSVSYQTGALIIEDNLPPTLKRVVKSPTPGKALDLLRQGRVDVVVDTRRDAERALEDMDWSGAVIHEPPLEQVNIYHYVHKKNRALVPKLEAVLRKMQKQGRIRSILQDH